MPYACAYDVPADEQLYQRVKTEIGADRPVGLIVHLVVQSDRGLRHIGVWNSRGDWERFRDERVQPAVVRVLSAVGVRQLPPRPIEEEMRVVDVLTGA